MLNEKNFSPTIPNPMRDLGIAIFGTKARTNDVKMTSKNFSVRDTYRGNEDSDRSAVFNFIRNTTNDVKKITLTLTPMSGHSLSS